jgi:hypothetical protein
MKCAARRTSFYSVQLCSFVLFQISGRFNLIVLAENKKHNGLDNLVEYFAPGAFQVSYSITISSLNICSTGV